GAGPVEDMAFVAIAYPFFPDEAPALGCGGGKELGRVPLANRAFEREPGRAARDVLDLVDPGPGKAGTADPAFGFKGGKDDFCFRRRDRQRAEALVFFI